MQKHSNKNTKTQRQKTGEANGPQGGYLSKLLLI